MDVRSVRRAHLFDRGGEESIPIENIRVFREETEDQPRREMVHVVLTSGCIPLRVFRARFNVKLVEATRSADVEGTLANLLNCADACQRQEETEKTAGSSASGPKAAAHNLRRTTKSCLEWGSSR
jgi:hypothetical protein